MTNSKFIKVFGTLEIGKESSSHPGTIKRNQIALLRDKKKMYAWYKCYILEIDLGTLAYIILILFHKIKGK